MIKISLIRDQHYQHSKHNYVMHNVLYRIIYDLRKVARNEGRRYCDLAVLTYQAERMPEQLWFKYVNLYVMMRVVVCIILRY